MGWDPSDALDDFGDSLKKQYKDFEKGVKENALAGLAYFISPIIAQDIAGAAFGGAYAGGADARTQLSAGVNAPTKMAAGEYKTEDWQDLAAFNAAIATGAGVTAAMAAPAAITIGGVQVGSVAGASALTAGAAGAAAGAGAYGLYAGSRDQTYADTGAPTAQPGMNQMYKNDPQQQQQFQRLRRAARMLGRAGTIKYKGSGSSLGLGEGMLGDQLSLIGS
jgi:hypothetical protein